MLGFEEYLFHRAREKPHSLLFGQIFVREHRRAVSQVCLCPLLFFIVVGVLHAWHDVGLKRVPSASACTP
jgi:hypothetical protein